MNNTVDFTREAGMDRLDILSSEVTIGMTLEIGGSKKTGWKPQLMDVVAIEGSPSTPVFIGASGKKIYRWGENWIKVLGFREEAFINRGGIVK